MSSESTNAGASPIDPAAEDHTGGITPPAPTKPSGGGGLGRHTAIYLTGMLVSRTIAFVMLPFYTHYLSPADYGITQLMEMTLDVIAIVAGTRIVSGIHRYYYKAETEIERQRVLSSALAILMISFLIFGVFTFVFATPLTRMVLGGTEHVLLMRIAAMTFVLQSLTIVPLGIVQLRKHSGLFTALTTGKLVLQLVLNIVFLAAFGLGVTGVFLSTLIATCVQALVLIVLVVRHIGIRIWGPAARSLLRYGVPLIGTHMATFFITYGDRYFLRVSGDVAEVGLYSLAYQFGFLVTALGYYPFSMIWEPTRFEVAHRPDRDAVYSRAFIFMNLVLMTAIVGCALFVRDFIMVMSDKAYHSAYLVVPVLLLSQIFTCWAYFHEVGILIRERTTFVTLANWVAAGLCFVGYSIFIPRYLSWGAAGTTVVAFAVRWIIIYVIAQRGFPIRYDWAPVTRITMLTVACVIVGLLLPHPGLGASLAMRSALLVVFLVVLWHIGVLRRADKQVLRTMLRSPQSALRMLRG